MIENRCITSREEQLRIVQACHAHPTSGHLGFTRTLARVTDQFFWKGMVRDTKQVVRKVLFFSSTHIPCCWNCVSFQQERQTQELRIFHTNLRDHSHSLGSQEQAIEIYDSLYSSLPMRVKECLAGIVFSHKPSLILKYMNVQWQQNLNDCGLHAIATVTAICHGIDAMEVTFDPKNGVPLQWVPHKKANVDVSHLQESWTEGSALQ